MPHPRYSSEEITRRGNELYEQRIRSLVETKENIGKIVSIGTNPTSHICGKPSATFVTSSTWRRYTEYAVLVYLC
jgi:hypothetical protein